MNAILKHVYQEVLDPTFPEAIIRRRFPKPKSESARFVPGSLSIKDGYRRDSGGGSGKRERERRKEQGERGAEREAFFSMGTIQKGRPQNSGIFDPLRPQIHPTSLTKL